MDVAVVPVLVKVNVADVPGVAPTAPSGYVEFAAMDGCPGAVGSAWTWHTTGVPGAVSSPSVTSLTSQSITCPFVRPLTKLDGSEYLAGLPLLTLSTIGLVVLLDWPSIQYLK